MKVIEENYTQRQITKHFVIELDDKTRLHIYKWVDQIDMPFGSTDYDSDWEFTDPDDEEVFEALRAGAAGTVERRSMDENMKIGPDRVVSLTYTVKDDAGEVLEVARQHRVAGLLAVGVREERERLAHDEAIGHPVQAEGGQGAVERPAAVLQGALQRAAARAAAGDQRPVHVPEDDRGPCHSKSASTNSRAENGFRSATVSPTPT